MSMWRVWRGNGALWESAVSAGFGGFLPNS